MSGVFVGDLLSFWAARGPRCRIEEPLDLEELLARIEQQVRKGDEPG
jgi:hypothetical protein